MIYFFNNSGLYSERRLIFKDEKTESMSRDDLEKHAQNLEGRLDAQQIEIRNLQDLLKRQQEALDHIASNPNMPHLAPDQRWTTPAVEHIPARTNPKAAAHERKVMERQWLGPKARTYLQEYPERYQRFIPTPPVRAMPQNTRTEAPRRMPPVQAESQNRIIDRAPSRSFRKSYNRIDGLHYEFWDAQNGIWTKGPQIVSYEQAKAQGERNRYARERHFADRSAKYRSAGYILKDWNAGRQDVRWQTLDQRMGDAADAGMDPLMAAPRSVHQANISYGLDMDAFEQQFAQNRMPVMNDVPERELTANQTTTLNQLLHQWQRMSLHDIVYWNDAVGNLVLWRPVATDAWEGMSIDRLGIARSLGIGKAPPSKVAGVKEVDSSLIPPSPAAASVLSGQPQQTTGSPLSSSTQNNVQMESSGVPALGATNADIARKNPTINDHSRVGDVRGDTIGTPVRILGNKNSVPKSINISSLQDKSNFSIRLDPITGEFSGDQFNKASIVQLAKQGLQLMTQYIGGEVQVFILSTRPGRWSIKTANRAERWSAPVIFDVREGKKNISPAPAETDPFASEKSGKTNVGEEIEKLNNEIEKDLAYKEAPEAPAVPEETPAEKPVADVTPPAEKPSLEPEVQPPSAMNAIPEKLDAEKLVNNADDYRVYLDKEFKEGSPHTYANFVQKLRKIKDKESEQKHLLDNAKEWMKRDNADVFLTRLQHLSGSEKSIATIRTEVKEHMKQKEETAKNETKEKKPKGKEKPTSPETPVVKEETRASDRLEEEESRKVEVKHARTRGASSSSFDAQ